MFLAKSYSILDIANAFTNDMLLIYLKSADGIRKAEDET